jgi:PAS domain S-box-containing protein
MSVRLKNRLSFKQARLAVLIAISLGLLFGAVQIAFDFKNEQTRVDTSILQFLSTVHQSASQAAYGLEETLAKRVLSGLFQNKSIVRAEISLDLGGHIATADRTSSVKSEHIILDLIFPDEQKPYSMDLFVEGHADPVGALTVWIHTPLAYEDFFDRMGLTLLLGLVRSIILAVLLMVAFYFQLTKRLVQITNMVSAIDPKTPKEAHIDVPLPEHRDELGVLSAVFNEYISNQESHLTELTKSEERRRHSEQRFKVFAESSSDWFWETDTEGRITWASDAVAAKSGRSFDDIKNKTREEISGILMSENDWRPYRTAMENREDIKNFEYFYVGMDGSVRSAEVNGKPVFNDAGEYLGYQGTASNITERKQAGKNLQAALAEAKEANKAKSEFLATMSHEFRTPLNAILGFADILSNQYFGPIDNKYKEYADDIYSSGEHLLTLVNDILDLSTIEAGKQSLAKDKLSTEEVVRECVRIVSEKAYSSGIDLITEVPKDLPPLFADKRAYKQILLNLLSNAVKFTPQSGRVTVSAKASKRNTTLKIADTGRGIPANKLPKLTDPFTRADNNPYLAEQGWGLGLAITKSLIDLHEGKLDIKSKVGKGTTVTVTLPNGAS